MRKSYYLYLFLLGVVIKAQVGIGTTVLSETEAIKLEANDKGLLLPRMNLADIYNLPDPVVNPKENLLVFNTDPAEEGLHFSIPHYNMSTGQLDGSAWESIVDSQRMQRFVTPITTIVKNSTGGVAQTSGAGGAIPYTLGSTPTSTPNANWVKLPGMEKDIVLDSSENDFSVLGEGFLQLNNLNNSGYFYQEAHSFAVGVFIDGKLASVRTFVLVTDYYVSCAHQLFTIKYNGSNLSEGTHKIELYAITRAKDSGEANKLTWNGVAPGCTNVNTVPMTQGTLAVQFQQY